MKKINPIHTLISIFWLGAAQFFPTISVTRKYSMYSMSAVTLPSIEQVYKKYVHRFPLSHSIPHSDLYVVVLMWTILPGAKYQEIKEAYKLKKEGTTDILRNVLLLWIDSDID